MGESDKCCKALWAVSRLGKRYRNASPFTISNTHLTIKYRACNSWHQKQKKQVARDHGNCSLYGATTTVADRSLVKSRCLHAVMLTPDWRWWGNALISCVQGQIINTVRATQINPSLIAPVTANAPLMFKVLKTWLRHTCSQTGWYFKRLFMLSWVLWWWQVTEWNTHPYLE